MDSTNIGNETISLKSILIGYLRHWRLFLGTFVISLIPAVLYLIYYPTTYEIMARFKVQDDTSMYVFGRCGRFDEIFWFEWRR